MFGLDSQTLNLIQQSLASFPSIQEARIFGSRATGTYQPGSDIDIAIYTDGTEDLSGRIQTILDALPTPYLFDVVDYTSITHPPLKEHIDLVGQILYQQ